MKELKDVLPSPNYTFYSPYRQCFSFPKYVTDYAIQNLRSGKLWRKLLMSCKYFFSKKQVIPVANLNYDSDTLQWKAKMFSGWWREFERMILKELKFKLWLFGEVSICSYRDDLVSIIKQKTYQFDLTRLTIGNQSLTYDEFLIFTGSGKLTSLTFFEVPVKYEDGSLVPFDKICQNHPNISRIHICSDSDAIYFEPDTTKNLVEIISRYSKLRQFFIDGISDNFDLPIFAEYSNTDRKIYISLEFFNTVSENFKEQVEEFRKGYQGNSFRPTLRFGRRLR